MPRSYYRDAPPSPLRSMPRGGSTIADLWMAIGQTGAQGALAQGDIWGDAIRGIGENVGGAIQTHQAQQAKAAETQRMAVNDAAATKVIAEWDGQDAQGLFARLATVQGQQKAMETTKAVVAFHELGDKRDEQNIARMATILPSVAKMKLPQFEAMWPGMQQMKSREIAAQFGVTPEIVAAMPAAEAYATIQQAFGAQPKLRNVGPGESVVNEADLGAGAMFTAPTVPKRHMVTVPAPGGGPMQKLATEEELAAGVPGYRAPREAPQPSFQAKEILNDAGSPVMANYNASTGRYTDIATGQTIKAPRPVPSAEETKDARKFKQAGPILDAVSELSEKINTLQGVYAKASGEAAKAKAKVNLDDDVAEYEALIQGFTPLVARALGHTGVLTQQDVDSVRMLFPQPGNSKSLRDRKIARINSIIGQLEVGSAPGGAPPGSPPADGKKPPATVRFQGRDVPFDSLPPDMQALVLAQMGR